MKRVRLYIITIMATACICCIASETQDEAYWVQDFILTKSIAVVLGFLTYKLGKYWDSKGLLPKDDFKDVEI